VPFQLAAVYNQYLGLVRAVNVALVFPVSLLPISTWVSVEVRVVGLSITIIRADLTFLVAPAVASIKTTYSVCPAGGVNEDERTLV
jgi:hypothetical protein